MDTPGFGLVAVYYHVERLVGSQGNEVLDEVLVKEVVHDIAPLVFVASVAHLAYIVGVVGMDYAWLVGSFSLVDYKETASHNCCKVHFDEVVILVN